MRLLFSAVVLAIMIQGCAVVTVADAAVSVTATAVKTTANVAGAVVDAAIPDGDDK
ncbi:MAG: NF038104 family lipoprotein [Sulfuricurvum sp.]